MLNGWMTEVTLTVGLPVWLVDRYSSCVVLSAVGMPNMWYGMLRVANTVPGLMLSSGLLPEYV